MKELVAALDSRHCLQKHGQGRLLFRVDPIPFESPRGYLCRTAHAHGYYGTWWLADLAGITPGALEREDRATRVAHVLRLTTSEWLQMCYRPVKGKNRFEQRFFLGQVIGASHLNYRRPRICPCCLRDRSVWWTIWDLKLVSACPIHLCRLIDRCPACDRKLTWHQRAMHTCRCGMDLRRVKPEKAEDHLVRINAAIYRAAGFCQESCEAGLRRANFLPALADLRLDALLRLIQFLGSIQEQGTLRRKQILAFAELGSATEIGIAAARVLMDWPLPFREMLKRMVPGQVDSAADLNFHEVFGNFYRHLFHVLPRSEFGFLHDAFEKFVLEDWQGLVRGQHRWFSTAIRKSAPWMTAAEGEKVAGIHSQRIGTLVRRSELEGMFVKTGRHRTECWIRRNSLIKWTATHEAELARYMPRPEAARALGLKNDTLLKVAQAGLIRYVSGTETFVRRSGYYFLREDVLRIKHVFEQAAVDVRPYSSPGELIALHHGLKNYLGRDSGLPSAIRAVVEGELIPIGYTKRFRGITGYLFRADDLRKYRPVNVEMPPGGFLSYQEAARSLGTKTNVIRGLVAHGVLSTPNKYRFGLAKLIPFREVQHFAEEYMPVSTFAKHCSQPIYWVVRCLRQAKVPMLEISIPARRHKIFLLKKIAAKTRVLGRRSGRDKPGKDHVTNCVTNVG